MVIFTNTNLKADAPGLALLPCSHENMPFLFRKRISRQESTPEKPIEYYVKLILLGNSGAGKTTLAHTFVSNQPPKRGKRRDCVEMSNVAFKDKCVDVREKRVLLRLYDTAGQEKYRSLTASYYRGANGCLVLYDVTRESSFDSITYWLHDLKEYTSQPKISTIIVGTKCHVPPEKREVTFERATKFAESLGLPYMEVSAEEGINVTEVFEKLADLIIENLEKSQAPITIETNRVSLTSQVSKRKHSWCSC